MDKKTQGAGKRVGRPPVDEPRKARGVRMTDLEWATFLALGGGEWLRGQLAAAELTQAQQQEREATLLTLALNAIEC
jgi:hypothetical protein